MIRLIRREGASFPREGFPFRDPKTGHRFDGLEAGGFYDQVRRIIKYRVANPGLYPPENGQLFDQEAVSLELETYTCNRLGNDPRFCRDSTILKPYPKVVISNNHICPVCKGAMEERYCPTCSGRKLIGYKCPRCHVEMDR